jgi:hypothetical protein
MSNTWNKVVLESGSNSISQNTTGTASGLGTDADGVQILLPASQGGTGTALTGDGLLVQNSDQTIGTLSTTTQGEVLQYTSDGYGFAPAPAISLEDGTNILTTGESDVTFAGNVTINGTLTATFIDYDTDVYSTDNGLVVLNNNGATVSDGDMYGMLVDIDQGGTAKTGIVYKIDDTNGDKFKAVNQNVESDIALMSTSSSAPTTSTDGENGIGSLMLVDTGTAGNIANGLYIRTV